MSKNTKTIADVLKEAPVKTTVPWKVHRIFMGPTVYFAGNQASFSDHGDYADLTELRHAVEWYVKQLNGKVTWNE